MIPALLTKPFTAPMCLYAISNKLATLASSATLHSTAKTAPFDASVTFEALCSRRLRRPVCLRRRARARVAGPCRTPAGDDDFEV